MAASTLKAILDNDLDSAFETIVGWQAAHALQPKGLKCGRVQPSKNYVDEWTLDR